MNPFVNPNKRGVGLPAGYKDLMDMIQRPYAVDTSDLSYVERFKQPEISKGTLQQVEVHIGCLFTSKGKWPTLAICCGGKGSEIALTLREPERELQVIFTESEFSRAASMRDVFRDSGISPKEDIKGVVKEGRCWFLNFPLPSSAPEAARLIVDVLRRSFAITGEEKVGFIFY
jgi:hypothetical protein